MDFVVVVTDIFLATVVIETGCGGIDCGIVCCESFQTG